VDNAGGVSSGGHHHRIASSVQRRRLHRSFVDRKELWHWTRRTRAASFRGSIVALNEKTGAILWKTFDMPENGGETGGYSGGAILATACD